MNSRSCRKNEGLKEEKFGAGRKAEGRKLGAKFTN